MLYKTLSNVISDMFKTPSLTDDDIPSPTNRPLLYYMSLREHPVGSVYQSSASTEPKYLFGGTWEKDNSGAVIRAGDYGTPGADIDISDTYYTTAFSDYWGNSESPTSMSSGNKTVYATDNYNDYVTFVKNHFPMNFDLFSSSAATCSSPYFSRSVSCDEYRFVPSPRRSPSILHPRAARVVGKLSIVE